MWNYNEIETNKGWNRRHSENVFTCLTDVLLTVLIFYVVLMFEAVWLFDVCGYFIIQTFFSIILQDQWKWEIDLRR